MAALYLRVDLLNVFDHENLVDYIDEISPTGQVTGRMNPVGNISGYPRTVRASFGVKF